MKFILTIFTIFVAVLFLSCCSGPYRDGHYEGQSRSIYTSEPYVGFVKLEVKNGYIVSVDYKIIDTLANELFDDQYEKHYTGNEKYIQQCRNDWKGVNRYPKLLLKVQNLKKIDAISGATWSYNIFRQSAQKALKNAQ
jgi:major membrane immunogen (membrane-anchored lipoprotein)